jgi:hypothetical protein
VKPFYLSSETVLPIRSTYQIVLPFKRNLCRYSLVTVTAYDDKVTDNTARGTATIVDTATGSQLLSAPRTLTPAPAGVAVCSVAVLGLPLTVSGLSGNEKVHVFGQGMNPLSIVVPPNTANMRVTLPAAPRADTGEDSPELVEPEAREVLINRSAYQVKPFYLPSETVLHIR